MAKDETPPKPRGRPRVEEPGTSVSTWLPPSEHDRLIKLAHREEKSLSAIIRELLLKHP